MAGPQDHLQINLADADDTARAIREVRERLDGGRLDALVNNAAISPKGPGGSRLGLFETEFADWLKVFQVNFFAPALLARGLGAELERAQGTIVNVTSIAGSRVHPFAGVAYATSKAALAALTREMAADFGPRGVRSGHALGGTPRSTRPGSAAPGRADHPPIASDMLAAVDQQLGAVDVARLLRAEEIDRLRHFLRGAQSAHRDLRDDRLGARR